VACLNRAPRAHPREHLFDEGNGRSIASGPRRHALAAVRRNLSRQSWDGAWHLGLRDEGHDAKLRETAVVELDQQTALLLLGGLVLREAKGVEEVEGRVANLRADRREGRERARLATLHVVLVHCALAPELEESDEEENLPLGVGGKGIPLGGRAASCCNLIVRHARERQGTGPVDAIRLNAEADECGHRNTPVLNLGVAQPADRARVVTTNTGHASSIGHPERVPELDDGVELDCHRLEVGLRLHDDGATRGDWRGYMCDRSEGQRSHRERQHGDKSDDWRSRNGDVRRAQIARLQIKMISSKIKEISSDPTVLTLTTDRWRGGWEADCRWEN